VLAGLSSPQKALPPKYFYDAEGSRLFEAITELEEYYPTRTELALLRTHAREIAEAIPDGAALVEFGSGASLKTRVLLDAAPQVAAYVPIDISAEALTAAADALARAYPGLTVAPLREDFTRALQLPAATSGRPIVGFFPGSTIGNFTHPEAAVFLARTREILGPGAVMIVGVDLQKEERVLNAAYDDAAGVTAEFNLNLLRRINRELGGNFRIGEFEHVARWSEAEGRVEMHLVSRSTQSVRIGNARFEFQAGESIHTENSYKYSIASFQALASDAGYVPAACWTDERQLFSVHALRVP
jgi:dimethylhistidine N-methyltransferase